MFPSDLQAFLANTPQESALEANPLNRGHQDKLTRFKNEVDIISRTLRLQRRNVLSSQLADCLDPRGIRSETQRFDSVREKPYYRNSAEAVMDNVYHVERPITIEMDDGPPQALGSLLDPTNISGVKEILLKNNLALIDRRLSEFQEMSMLALELEAWVCLRDPFWPMKLTSTSKNIWMIDSNKDRQETALYAFTIVTIVFLPLSTVAGILGMNVNDVRNMTQNQWVFWATALPLTAIIITLCLFWAGELDKVLKGLRNLWNRKNSKTRGTQDSNADLGSLAGRNRPGPFYTRQSRNSPRYRRDYI